MSLNFNFSGEFPVLTPDDAEKAHRMLVGRYPGMAERDWMVKNVNDQWITNGVMAIQWPWQRGRRTLLLYACCHGNGVIHVIDRVVLP